ncbi:uncharacterized protein LOC107263684 isoform X2 [Cephus cinctus]|uniref:Uncharacterized protein LOC107263684 isoform X2 n=1 Tax=Cephus cinctus TaxID=211228 RepID=A0AAJ7RA30_CEPCN|nr:uncharacterized protein LOC107263684 isoform X2 [Cephus cinctus]
MGDSQEEIISETVKSEEIAGRQSAGQKRRRTLTPMRPVAIAPKTNSPKNIQNFDLNQGIIIKTEPSFIAITSRENQITSNNSSSNKLVSNLDQYYTGERFNTRSFESISNGDGAKRLKLATKDDGIRFVIVQNQNLDTSNTIISNDMNDKVISKSKDYLQELSTVKKNTRSVHNIIQRQCNISDRINLIDSNDIPMETDITLKHSNDVSMINNLGTLSCDVNPTTLLPIQNSVMNNTNVNKELQKPNSTKLIENLNSNQTSKQTNLVKPKSQKPVVIMQQLLSPAVKGNDPRSKHLFCQSFNKILPINIQCVKHEGKVSDHTSQAKSNEAYSDELKIINTDATRNIYESKNELILKTEEFPAISSSQIDSVLKLIDMQTQSKEFNLHETVNYTKDNREYDGIKCTNNLLPCNQLIERCNDNLQCYKCKKCPFISLNDKLVMEHMVKDHSNIVEQHEQLVLKCPGCTNTFHARTSLLSHIVHDHQVQETEAQVMIEKLCYREKSIDENDNTKSAPEITVPIRKSQNESILQRQISSSNLEIDQCFDNIPESDLPIDNANTTVPTLENNLLVNNNEVQYLQNINNMQIVLADNIEVDRLQSIPILSDVRTISDKAYEEGIHVKDGESQGQDRSKTIALRELKQGIRNVECVDFKNESQIQEKSQSVQENTMINRSLHIEDTTFTHISENEVDLEKTEGNIRAVEPKKKGRPKGSKTNSNKQNSAELKQLGYKCAIPECGVRMLAQENIVFHQKCHAVITTDKSNMNYQCPECLEFKSNNWNNVAGHLWRSHIIDMELHACDLCSYKTPSLSNLMNQHRGIHGDDRPYLCDNCGKGFKTTKQLRNHRALHRAKNKEPLECEECRRVFTNTRLLKLHKDAVHKDCKPFMCNFCTYSASTRSALKLHLRRHTGLDHGLMFSCQYCSYRSVKKENLYTHMAKHEQNTSKTSEKSDSPITTNSVPIP